MSPETEFRQMLRALEKIFAAEGNPGGDEAAAALSGVLASPFDLPPPCNLEIIEAGATALETGGHTAAPAILAALPLIDWHHSGLADGRIRAEIAMAMATTELIGPDGMIFHPTVRAGLFMQIANLDYVTRTHPAEETFVMLGGAGYWTCNGSEPQRQEVGTYIHHPSGAPHTSITKQDPLIAAWRWTGDIGYEGYSLDG
jgi:mannose-6-phosphate isomerase-like protein (cupin superfamily)